MKDESKRTYWLITGYCHKDYKNIKVDLKSIGKLFKTCNFQYYFIKNILDLTQQTFNRITKNQRNAFYSPSPLILFKLQFSQKRNSSKGFRETKIILIKK